MKTRSTALLPGAAVLAALVLLGVARSVDNAKVERYRAERDYEGLELYILGKLMGK